MKKILFLICILPFFAQAQYHGTNLQYSAANFVLQLTNNLITGNTGILFVNSKVGDSNYFCMLASGAPYIGGYSHFKGTKFIIENNGVLDTATAVYKTESDPIFKASPAYKFTANDSVKWNTAYGWGNYKSKPHTLHFRVVDSAWVVQINRKYELGYSDGEVIDTIIYIMYAAPTQSGSVVPQIRYGLDISDTGTAVVQYPGTVISVTTATKVTTFTHATIPEGKMIWFKFNTVTTVPRAFGVVIKGHYQ